MKLLFKSMAALLAIVTMSTLTLTSPAAAAVKERTTTVGGCTFTVGVEDAGTAKAWVSASGSDDDCVGVRIKMKYEDQNGRNRWTSYKYDWNSSWGYWQQHWVHGVTAVYGSGGARNTSGSWGSMTVYI